MDARDAYPPYAENQQILADEDRRANMVYDTIQIELEEAVWIDGGTRLTSLIRVVLPLSVPAVGAGRSTSPA